MNVNGYLTRLAVQGIVRDSERASIDRSIGALRIRLKQYFKAALNESVVFGSYSRKTILPRKMDEESDVDIMVVFANEGLSPQRYFNYLRQFTMERYSNSEIAKSHPTIVLSLNHIRFELVPTIRQVFYGYQIPAKASDYETWLSTDPLGFNNKLSKVNKLRGNQIKPLIRLLKYWNAVNNYPFESYALEQSIVDHWSNFFLPSSRNQLKHYFYETVKHLDVSYWAASWKKDRINRARELVREAEKDEVGQTLASVLYGEKGLQAVKKILPPLGA